MESRWASLVVWAAIYALLFLTSFNIYYCLRLIPSENLCASHGKPWTPVTKGLEFTWQMFPALRFTTPSEFFGEPIEEADASWHEFLPESPIAIPKTRLHDLDIETNRDFVHLPRDKKSVLALPEVFVQLGCINLLRQNLNRRLKDNSTYTKNPAFQGSEEDILHRADLCIERLRDAFMCWGDVSSVLQTLTVETANETPRSEIDFGTNHKCRDFDAIAAWTTEHAVKAVRMRDMWWGGRIFY
ncbi:hypothetical protein TruAng_005950 [Truncatella angustata]|nr:hypothetical protein TruAng_005950 [Truncatella angustata]